MSDAIDIGTAARLLGIGADRLRQLVRGGLIQSPSRGQVSFSSALRGYAASLHASAAAPASTALARSWRIKAEIIAAETATRRADLVVMDRATATLAAISDLAVSHVRTMALPASLRGFPNDVAARIRDEAMEAKIKIEAARAVAIAALTSGNYGEIDG